LVTGTPFGVQEGSGTYVGVSVLKSALEAAGHTVEVLAPPPGPVSFPGRLLFNLRARAVVHARESDFDVVVGFDLDGFLLRRGKRRVAALKGVLADEAGFERGLPRLRLAVESLLEKRHVRRVERVITSSAYSAVRIAQAYGIPPERIAVVPEPIDLARWNRALEGVPPAASGVPTILCVAHLYPRKNVEQLLDAMALLPGPAALRVVGTGPERGRLETRARSLGVESRVAFLGHVPFDTLAAEYRRADLFCLPSRQEGFGIVFLEAMAAGLPVVAARAAAVPGVVSDGEDGILVSPDSPAELAAVLGRLLSEPAERQRLGEIGRGLVARFDAPLVAQQFLAAAGLAPPRGDAENVRLAAASRQGAAAG
jgi:glycosyltransferase involved in cell wall biosynthesis